MDLMKKTKSQLVETIQGLQDDINRLKELEEAAKTTSNEIKELKEKIETLKKERVENTSTIQELRGSISLKDKQAANMKYELAETQEQLALVKVRKNAYKWAMIITLVVFIVYVIISLCS